MKQELYFVADLDGTLLHKSRKYLYPALAEEEEIRALIEEGHQFVIATGRGYGDIEVVASNLGIPIPYAIVQNGAFIYKDGVEVSANTLGLELINEVFAFIKSEKIPAEYIAVTDDQWKMHIKTLTWKGWGVRRVYQKRDKHRHLKMKKSTLATLEANNYRFCKVLLLIQSKNLPAAEAKLKAHFGERLAIFCSSNSSIEICAAGVSKAAAIRSIMAMEGLTEEYIGFVGDSGNDVGVFESFPHTYVMDHAPERYKIAGTHKVVAVSDAIKHFKQKRRKR